jgi:N-formylglutamate amidohydrolase
MSLLMSSFFEMFSSMFSWSAWVASFFDSSSNTPLAETVAGRLAIRCTRSPSRARLYSTASAHQLGVRRRVDALARRLAGALHVVEREREVRMHLLQLDVLVRRRLQVVG